MKIVTVLASPKGMKGYTGKLVAPMIEAVESAGAEHKLIAFNEVKVNHCKGCVPNCHKTGKCHQKDDDFAAILEQLLAADGIIFATPNYMFSVTAQLKSLLDRCSYPLHTGQFKHKHCATLVTCGGSDAEMVHDYLKEILTTFGFWNVGRISGVQLQFEDPEENESLRQQSFALGKQLAEAVAKKTEYDDQREAIEQAFEIMGFLVQANKDVWPLAWKHWTENLGMEEIEM